MKNDLTITAPTTTELDQAVATLPPEFSVPIFALLDDRDTCRASDCDLERRRVPDEAQAAHARAARTARIEAVVKQAIEDKLRGLKALQPHQRATWLQTRIKNNPIRYGEPTPSVRRIRRILNTWSF